MNITRKSVRKMTAEQKRKASIYVCKVLGMTLAKPNYIPGDIIFTATKSMDFVVKDLSKKSKREETTRLGPGDSIVLHMENLNFSITVTPLFKSQWAKL